MTQPASPPSNGAANHCANHCAELLGNVPQKADIAALTDEFGKTFAKALGSPLGELMGGAKLKVTCASIKNVDASNCVDKQEALAAHFLLGQSGGGNNARALVATIGGAGALTICDKAFGGNGEIADPLPEKLPLSANLTLARLGECLGIAVSAALDGGDVSLLARGEKLARLVPFGRIAECAAIEISVQEDDQTPWTVTLLAEAGALGEWLGENDQRRAQSPAATIANHIPGNTAALHEIPLPVTAILGESKLPLAKISRLKVGDFLPLSMRRDVPLIVGSREVASGTVGTVDDRVAIQISQIFMKGAQ